jgi:gluconolactonase
MEIEPLSPRLSQVLAPDARLEQVATGFRFTEGPLWDPRTSSLLFSDIPAARIYRWTPGGEAGVYREGSNKSNGLAWDLQGRLLACEHVGRRVSLALADGSVVPVAERYGGKRLNSPNDLVLRSDGSLYFSDPPYGIQSADMGALAEQEQPHNGLYLVPPGAEEPTLLATDFERPNGMAFTPDEGRLYVADTPRYHIRIFSARADGTLEGGEVFARFDKEKGEGRPDGMKVDTQGNLYTTGPGGLWILAPDGTFLAHVRVPEKAANCAWGDEDYRSLYVTASTSVYRLRTLVPGVVPPGARQTGTRTGDHEQRDGGRRSGRPVAVQGRTDR